MSPLSTEWLKKNTEFFLSTHPCVNVVSWFCSIGRTEELVHQTFNTNSCFSTFWLIHEWYIYLIQLQLHLTLALIFHSHKNGQFLLTSDSPIIASNSSALIAGKFFPVFIRCKCQVTNFYTWFDWSTLVRITLSWENSQSTAFLLPHPIATFYLMFNIYNL